MWIIFIRFEVCIVTGHYGCDECEETAPPLKTKSKLKLNPWFLKHKRDVHGSIDLMLSCDKCSYKTLYLKNLNRHKNSHQALSTFKFGVPFWHWQGSLQTWTISKFEGNVYFNYSRVNFNVFHTSRFLRDRGRWGGQSTLGVGKFPFLPFHTTVLWPSHPPLSLRNLEPSCLNQASSFPFLLTYLNVIRNHQFNANTPKKWMPPSIVLLMSGLLIVPLEKEQSPKKCRAPGQLKSALWDGEWKSTKREKKPTKLKCDLLCNSTGGEDPLWLHHVHWRQPHAEKQPDYPHEDKARPGEERHKRRVQGTNQEQWWNHQ